MTPAETKALQTRIGVKADGIFGPASRTALFAKLANKSAKALTTTDMQAAANDLGVKLDTIRGVRKVEAPRGAYDDRGRPTILYEKHVFGRCTDYRFNKSHPALSSSNWQPGTYGPFSAQYGKLEDATKLDLVAAFEACSWGAFQVLGENAVKLGYLNAVHMALDLVGDEAAHLDCFVRFVKWKRLDDELRLCRADDPDSCIPFVSVYNGAEYAQNRYHINFAAAMAA